MHPAAVSALRCATCTGSLILAGDSPRQLRCAAGHTFDLARHGYVDLSGGRLTHDGDTVGMVAARVATLAAGHLDLVSRALVETVRTQLPAGGLTPVLDVGTGTGHHLAHLLEARTDLVGVGVDVSKAALRRAGRAHPRLAAVRADAWRGLPVRDGAAGLLLSVFAPRSPAEFHRVLAPGSALVVVTPDPAHLADLVTTFGLVTVDPAKRERLAATLTPWFEPVTTEHWNTPLTLSHADLRSLIQMGPSAWHVDPDVLGRQLAEIAEPVGSTLAIVIDTWRKRAA